MPSALVVEDDLAVALALVRELTRLGFTARFIANTSLVEGVLSADRPSIIVSDYRMPGRSGVEILESAKLLFPEIRRCLVSGSLSELHEDDLARIEPCAYLSKPWTREQLRALVEDLLVTPPEDVPEFAEPDTRN